MSEHFPSGMRPPLSIKKFVEDWSSGSQQKMPGWRSTKENFV